MKKTEQLADQIVEIRVLADSVHNYHSTESAANAIRAIADALELIAGEMGGCEDCAAKAQGLGDDAPDVGAA